MPIAATRQLLQEAERERFSQVDYDTDDSAFDVGEVELLELHRPMEEAAIGTFECDLPAPLPDDIRELLRFASGFSLGQYEVEFCRYGDWGYDFLLPRAVVLARDASGNAWAIEVDDQSGRDEHLGRDEHSGRDDHSPPGSPSGRWEHVWFICHDPPVIVYLCPTLAEFIDGILDTARLQKCLAGHGSIVHGLEKRCQHLWRDRNRRFPSAASLLSHPDPVLRDFAASLRAKTRVADLRKLRLGSGFEWSALSSNRTPLRRAGTELVFAIETRPGLLSRLLGRS